MGDPTTKGRMIKTDISNSKTFASLSPEAAVLFCMIIPHLNSYGKMNGGTGYIKDEVCPRIPYLTANNLGALLQEISSKTNMKWFEYEGRYWLHSIKFLTDHQTLKPEKLGRDQLPTYSGVSRELVKPPVEVTENLVTHEVKVEVEVEVKEEGADQPVKPVDPPPPDPKPPRQVFKPPTLDEVTAYCQERGKGVDPVKWFNHYTANGWKVGKNKMVNWKAAIHTWERDNGARQSAKPNNQIGGGHYGQPSGSGGEFKSGWTKPRPDWAKPQTGAVSGPSTSVPVPGVRAAGDRAPEETGEDAKLAVREDQGGPPLPRDDVRGLQTSLPGC